MFTSCAQELLDHDAQSGTKKPKLLENLAHVVPGTTQQRMYRITFNAFEEVSSPSAIRLHVPNHRLDRIASVLEQLQAPHQTNRMAWPTHARSVQSIKAPLAGLAVDLLGQLGQGLAQVDQIDQFLAEQI